MKPKLIKTSAILLILGALSWIAAEILELSRGLSQEFLVLTSLAFAGKAIGIWSAHFGHGSKGGKTSLIGTTFLSIAFLIFSGGALDLLSARDVSLDLAGESSELAGKNWLFAGFLLMVSGAPLLGISTIQARVYPLWVGCALVLGTLVAATTALTGLFSNLFSNLNNMMLAICFITMAWFVLSGRADLNDSRPDRD